MPRATLVGWELAIGAALLLAGLAAAAGPLVGTGRAASDRSGGALQAVVVACAALAAGAVALALAVGVRRHRDPDEARRYGRPFRVENRMGLAALLVLLVAGTLAVIAVAGTLLDHGHRTARPLPQSVPGRALPAGPSSPATRPGGGSGSAFPWATVAIVALAGAGLGVTLRVLASRDRASGDAATTEGVEPDAPLSRASGFATVDDDRGAVLAAYTAMEAALAQRGSRRRAAETPREYVERVFDGTDRLWGERLTTLFERARFDTEPITHLDRRRAERALANLELAP